MPNNESVQEKTARLAVGEIMKPCTAWAVVSPHDTRLHYWYTALTRSEAIANWVGNWTHRRGPKMFWRYWYNRGWRVVRVQITVIE